MRFDGLIGNAECKEQLSTLSDSGRMPHALLIEGPAGSGREDTGPARQAVLLFLRQRLKMLR